MDGLVDRRGALYLLYRSAREVVHRDTYLLVSRDGAKSFTSARLQEWMTLRGENRLAMASRARDSFSERFEVSAAARNLIEVLQAYAKG